MWQTSGCPYIIGVRLNNWNKKVNPLTDRISLAYIIHFAKLMTEKRKTNVSASMYHKLQYYVNI